MTFEAVEQLDADQQVMKDLNALIDKEVKFITLPDGQWEEGVKNKWGSNRPRYTLDITSANIAKAWAEMARNEYVSTTSPSGGEATKEVSEVIDGILRETYERSSFDVISSFAGKRMIGVGEAAWRINTEYEPGTFNQRFRIDPVYDSSERVWWDAHSTRRDRSDANHVTITTYVSESEAKSRWGDGREFESVSTTRSQLQDLNTPDDRILIAERIYREPYKVTLYLLETGQVIEGDEGLSAIGITKEHSAIKRARDETRYKIYSRHFDNNDWLDKKPKELVFDRLPIIPIYANFSVLDGKVLYHGMVRQIMDHARIYNYVESRKVEDAVLGIPDHLMVADKQAVGKYGQKLAEINRTPNRAFVYKPVEGLPPPYMNRGSQPNPALTELSNDMVNSIQLTTGLPMTLAEMEANSRDSDFRANRRDSIGQMGTYEYYKAYSLGLEATSLAIIKAIPRVIDTQRKVKTMSEAGSMSEVEVNKNENGKIVNNLTVGDYGVTVTVGASLKDRQAEANTGILEAAAIEPSILSRNTDIVAGNNDAPGMREVAERERAYQFRLGNIPPEQWTEEEEQQMLQAQQNQQPDPASLIAQAEIERARTEAETAQFKMLEAQAKLEEAKIKRETDTTIKALELQLKERDIALRERAQDTQNLLNVSKSIESLAKTDQTIDNSTLDKVEDEI